MDKLMRYKINPAGNIVLPKAGLNGFDWTFVSRCYRDSLIEL